MIAPQAMLYIHVLGLLGQYEYHYCPREHGAIIRQKDYILATLKVDISQKYFKQAMSAITK